MRTVLVRGSATLLLAEVRSTRLPGPGFIPAPGCVKAVVEGDFRGELYDMDLWFKYTAGDVTLGALSALANQMQSAFVPGLVFNFSNDVTIRRIKLRDYTVINGFVWEQSFTPITGSGGDAMPNNVALSVSFRTSQAGRSYRGRNYVGGVPRTQVVENEINEDWITEIVNGYSVLRASASFLTNWVWSVVSFKNAGAWRAAGIATEIVEVICVDNIVDTMQKRLPKRGQ